MAGGLEQTKLKEGETAFIDDRYRTGSFITGKLVDVMEKCWGFTADDRIDIFEAVRMLRLAKEEYYEKKKPDQGQPQALPDNGNVVV
jgi:hypothetical protein